MPSRQEKAAATRERLVTTARTLFTEKGYFATGTNEIVERAEVGTRGAFYHHFDSKEALFTEVLERIEVDLATRAAKKVNGATAAARLHQGLMAFLDASLEPEVRRVLLIDGPAVLGWEAWRAIEARHGLGAIEFLLSEGKADGSLRVADVTSLAHLLLAAIDESALYIANAPKPQQARRKVGASVAALLSGLIERATSPETAPPPTGLAVSRDRLAVAEQRRSNPR